VDLEEIKVIIDLMKKNSITEFEWEKEGCRVRLKRTPEGVWQQIEAPPPQALPSGLPSAAPSKETVPPSSLESPSQPASEEIEIKAPMVGTFYRAPAPDAAPYVDIGSEVEPDTVVCLIEAMKVMNEIKAEVKGVITEILAENGKPVEYGQPLFRVRPK